MIEENFCALTNSTDKEEKAYKLSDKEKAFLIWFYQEKKTD